MRFKCVSKSCCALIRNPYFMDQHSALRRDAPHLLLNYCGHYDSRYEQTILTATPNGGEPSPIPSNILERGPFYLSCCHGLISLHPRHQAKAKGNTFVYNPNTRETLSIPFNANAFKDGKSVRSFIGFEPVSNQYKLMIFGTWPEHVTRCEIITIRGTEDWRRVVVPRIHDGKGARLDWLTTQTEDGWSSQCLNGALHWPTSDSHHIVVFDLQSDKFHIIPGPKKVREGPFIKFQLCQVHGRLTLAQSRAYYGEKLRYELWTLKDYYNGVWVKQRIDFYAMKDLFSTPDDRNFYLRLVGGIDDDEFLISIWGQVFGYNMKTKQSRKINIRIFHQHYLYIMPYTESMRCY